MGGPLSRCVEIIGKMIVSVSLTNRLQGMMPVVSAENGVVQGHSKYIAQKKEKTPLVKRSVLRVSVS